MEIDYDRSTATLSRFFNCLAELSKLRARLGSTKDDKPLRGRIEVLLSDCRGYVKELNVLVKRKNVGGRQRARHNKLLVQFQDGLERYRTLTEDILHLQKEYQVRSYSNYASSSLTYGQGNFMAQQYQEAPLEGEEQDVDELLIREVNEEMALLQDELTVLNELMVDVGEMIEEQGEDLDEVETNIETVNINVVAGNKDLKKTAKLAGASFILMMIICLIITGVILAILFIVVVCIVVLYFALRK